jgi:hypothetical protein
VSVIAVSFHGYLLKAQVVAAHGRASPFTSAGIAVKRWLSASLKTRSQAATIKRRGSARRSRWVSPTPAHYRLLALPGLVTDRARLVQRMGAVRTGRSRSVAATAVAMIAASAGTRVPQLTSRLDTEMGG